MLLWQNAAIQATAMSDDELDLLYILGDGSDWDNNEIRYSLRSAELYFPHRKVFIIGECPSWLQNVIHIPYPDIFGVKTANGVAKVMRAVKDPRLSERFVLMNDDFFFLKKQRAIPYYYRGKTSEFIDRHRTKGGYYYQTLQNTEKCLMKRGIKNPKDYAVHSPIIYEKSKLRKLKGRELKGCSLRSVYCNLLNVRGRKTEDFKANTMDEFKYQLSRNAPVFSSSDEIVKERAFLDWISTKFPTPSKYEADNWHLNLI